MAARPRLKFGVELFSRFVVKARASDMVDGLVLGSRLPLVCVVTFRTQKVLRIGDINQTHVCREEVPGTSLEGGSSGFESLLRIGFEQAESWDPRP